jgi:hypothetical protein
MFLFGSRSDLFGTRPIPWVSSAVHSLSLFPWDGQLYPYFRCVCVRARARVCAVRSYLLVLHISGENEFTKLCLCSVCAVFVQCLCSVCAVFSIL